MNDRGVTDGDVVADMHAGVVGEMHDRVVLHIAPLAHHDAVDVAPQHRSVEDAAVFSELHIAHHRGVGGDKHRPANVGHFS